MKFDLRERTGKFAVNIIKLVRIFPKDTIGLIMGKQVLRAGTSIGANLEEADAASSRRDFFHKISISRKEAQETYYWLSVAAKAQIFNNRENALFLSELLQEASELARILSSIASKERGQGIKN